MVLEVREEEGAMEGWWVGWWVDSRACFGKLGKLGHSLVSG